MKFTSLSKSLAAATFALLCGSAVDFADAQVRYVPSVPQPSEPSLQRERVIDLRDLNDEAARLRGNLANMQYVVNGYGSYERLRANLADMDRAVNEFQYTIDRREGRGRIRGAFSEVERTATRTDDLLHTIDEHYAIRLAWYRVLDSIDDTRRILR